MIKKEYWTGRPEKIITEGYGSHRLVIRYFADSNKAQISLEDISEFRFPLLWSHTVTDDQANAALELFRMIGPFDIPIMENETL